METLEEYKKEQCLNQNKDVLDLKQTQDKEELKKNQVEDCMLPLASKDLNNEFINKIIKEIEEFSYTFMENSSDYIKLKKHQETTCNFFINKLIEKIPKINSDFINDILKKPEYGNFVNSREKINKRFYNDVLLKYKSFFENKFLDIIFNKCEFLQTQYLLKNITNIITELNSIKKNLHSSTTKYKINIDKYSNFFNEIYLFF